jgi:AraC-like DNA-binding protein
MPAVLSLDDRCRSAERVAITLELLVRRFHDPNLTLSEAAGVAGVTREHLCRLLRRQTGLSFTAHLRRRRVSEAQQLLRSTSLSAKEIAFRVGFRNKSQFAHEFRRQCGVPPIAYRHRAAARGEGTEARP